MEHTPESIYAALSDLYRYADWVVDASEIRRVDVREVELVLRRRTAVQR